MPATMTAAEFLERAFVPHDRLIAEAATVRTGDEPFCRWLAEWLADLPHIDWLVTLRPFVPALTAAAHGYLAGLIGRRLPAMVDSARSGRGAVTRFDAGEVLADVLRDLGLRLAPAPAGVDPGCGPAADGGRNG